jgi:hypothetical protein
MSLKPNPYLCVITGAWDKQRQQLQAFKICVSVHWGTSFDKYGKHNPWSTPFTTTLTLQECMEDPNALMKVLTRSLPFAEWFSVDCGIGTENEVDYEWLGNFHADMGQERLTRTLYDKLFKEDVGVLATMHQIDIPRHTLTFMVRSRDARPY